MQTIKMHCKLLNEERETLIVYDPTQKMWVMDTMIPKHFRKALEEAHVFLRAKCYRTVIAVMGKEDYKDKTIVVLLPDTGERYLSTPLFS